MRLLYSFFRALDKISPARIAHAHCDIPCGIYDPHMAQMAAHTIIRMLTLTDELTANMKANQNPTAEDRRDFVHKLSRYTATKEKHADMCEHEVITLWADYFKPEHFQKYPQINELTFKALKLAGKARQEINMQASEELLETVNKIAEIYWETKGMGTARFPAPYPTGKETVYPTKK